MRENSFAHFFEIVKAVRNGCPWDKEQTPLSLRTTFFEETCEAIDAISQEDPVSFDIGFFILPITMTAVFFFPVFRHADEFIQDFFGKVCFRYTDILVHFH